MSTVFLFCLLVLLLPATHGASSQQASSYKVGSRQVFLKTPAAAGRSSGNSQQASTVPTATGLDKKKLAVVHRQSMGSRLHGKPSLTAADVLHTSDIRRPRISTQSSAAPAPSPAPTMITANASSKSRLPGALDYTVLVSYGTPAQQFPVFLDTSGIGASLLRCKPCASGSNSSNCDPAFDTSQSSTFNDVLCGSPDCPSNCSSAGGAVCPLDGLYSVLNATYASDVLTLAPSMAVQDFRFICLAVDEPEDQPVIGTLDLGRNRNSLSSQVSSSSSAAAAAFSYCLPQSPSSQGFLSLGVDATTRDANVTAHAPLLSSSDPELTSMYFIDLVGISLGDEDLSIPAGTFGNNDTNLDVGTAFTMLAPALYTPLRDSFQKQMSQYNNVSSPVGFAGFDTCFNFTDLDGLIVPNVEFKFGNGDSLMIYAHQMLYYDDPDSGPFTMTCLAFSILNYTDAFSAVIGTYTLGSTEVVYDVAGGKVGFVPSSC